MREVRAWIDLFGKKHVGEVGLSIQYAIPQRMSTSLLCSYYESLTSHVKSGYSDYKKI